MNLPCLEVDFSNFFRADWNIEALSRVVIAYTAVKINASSALVPLLVGIREFCKKRYSPLSNSSLLS